jgi:hypothetical protein
MLLNERGAAPDSQSEITNRESRGGWRAFLPLNAVSRFSRGEGSAAGGLVFLLTLALALRLVFLVLAGVNAPLVGDELAYQQIAANVAAGRGFVQDNNPFFPGQALYAWQAPFYPLSLAALYLIFGPHPIVAKLFGILLGVATTYLTFDLARRVFSAPPLAKGNPSLPTVRKGGGGRVAFLAALFVTVYPGLLTNAHLVLSETLFTFLLVLAFDLVAVAMDASTVHPPAESGSDHATFPLTNGNPSLPPSSPLPPFRSASGISDFEPLVPSPRAAYFAVGSERDLRLAKGRSRGVLLIAAAGAVWGLATLTRGITLYFVVPLAIWLVVLGLASTKPCPEPGRRVEWRGIVLKDRRVPLAFNLRLAIIFAVTMLLVIAPWTVRNLTVFQQFVLLETKGGVNFWLGNSPYTPPDFIRNVWKSGVREPMLAALPAGELARDRMGYVLGEAYVTQEPLTFVERMPVKFADFWGFERSLVDAAEATRNGKAGGWNSPAKIAADFVSDAAYVFLILLTVGGLVFAKADRWKLLLGSFILYFVIVHMVVFGDGRFHLPLIPFLALYAAWFIVNRPSVNRWRGLRGMTALACALAFAGVWLHEMAAALGTLR